MRICYKIIMKSKNFVTISVLPETKELIEPARKIFLDHNPRERYRKISDYEIVHRALEIYVNEP